MTEAFAIAALWLALAVVSTILANHLHVSIALAEICVGIVFGVVAEAAGAAGAPGVNAEWLRFLAAAGAVMLTFMAGAELEPAVLRARWKEVSAVGLIGFLAPFFGCAAAARYILGWEPRASWLAGVALSTTSMAVVYAVMLETGLNKTGFGKGILGACFINDLGTVAALGIIFAPFTFKTVVFLLIAALTLAALPAVSSWLTEKYAYRTAAIRTKWVLLVLFGLGALALWSGSEAVLPAYLAGMAFSGAAARDHHWVRRLRTLTVGLLTPFYFIRAGSLVSVPAVFSAPLIFLVLLGAKVASKIFGLYPAVGRFCGDRRERWYYTLLMSTGLTFGTISALYGLHHGIVSRDQYSLLVAVVIASAVIPTAIAGSVFLPKHLLAKVTMLDEEEGAEPEKNAASAVADETENGSCDK